MFTWLNGNRFQGIYKNDKRDGFGVMIWKDGRTYTGNYKDDETQGQDVRIS